MTDQNINLREEFRLKKFGFSNCKQERFYVSQWGNNRIAYLVYRILIFGYALGWIIADVLSIHQPLYWTFLTNWTEVTGCLYFLLALMVVAHGFATRHKENSQEELKWFHKTVWIVYSTAISAALATDIIFWVILSGYGLVYVIFTVILWGSGREPVYDVLNWEDAPGTAALYAFLTALVVLPLIHILIHFPLYLLRCVIARSCLRRTNRQQQPIDDNVEMAETKTEGVENNAFE